jgi:hypothetical protein
MVEVNSNTQMAILTPVTLKMIRRMDLASTFTTNSSRNTPANGKMICSMVKVEKSCVTIQCMKVHSKKAKRTVKAGTFGQMALRMKVSGKTMR